MGFSRLLPNTYLSRSLGASSGELKKVRNFTISARILRAVGLRRHG